MNHITRMRNIKYGKIIGVVITDESGQWINIEFILAIVGGYKLSKTARSKALRYKKDGLRVDQYRDIRRGLIDYIHIDDVLSLDFGQREPEKSRWEELKTYLINEFRLKIPGAKPYDPGINKDGVPVNSIQEIVDFFEREPARLRMSYAHEILESVQVFLRAIKK